MKLSTKGRYGLRATYYLAISSEPVMQLKALSVLTDVPEPYLEKILGMLKKGRVVETIRGVAGGYRLTDKPENITIGKILRCLEGELYLADCNRKDCNNVKCPNKSIFHKLYVEINNILDKLTLKDMIEK